MIVSIIYLAGCIAFILLYAQWKKERNFKWSLWDAFFILLGLPFSWFSFFGYFFILYVEVITKN